MTRYVHATASAILMTMWLPALAEMDVDQADSLNFEAFHKDKKEAVKAWSDDDEQHGGETVKIYEQSPAEPVSPRSPTKTLESDVKAPASTGTRGQRYEIRERYSITRSSDTPYSAFYVIEPLHREMARLCPAGWRKLAERSEPVKGDFHLYYQFECL